MDNIIAFIIIIPAIILNGLQCIILAYILRHYLVKLGKEYFSFGAGSISDIIELYKKSENTPKKKKYRRFAYYISVAYFIQASLFITLIILLA